MEYLSGITKKSGVGSAAGKALPGIGVAFDAYDGYQSGGVGTAATTAAGGFGGAAAGAAIGTAIMPGVGTFIGGTLGGLLGTEGGKAVGKGVFGARRRSNNQPMFGGNSTMAPAMTSNQVASAPPMQPKIAAVLGAVDQLTLEKHAGWTSALRAVGKGVQTGLRRGGVQLATSGARGMRAGGRGLRLGARMQRMAGRGMQAVADPRVTQAIGNTHNAALAGTTTAARNAGAGLQNTGIKMMNAGLDRGNTFLGRGLQTGGNWVNRLGTYGVNNAQTAGKIGLYGGGGAAALGGASLMTGTSQPNPRMMAGRGTLYAARQM